GGSISVLPVLPDGGLGPSTAFVQHDGPNPTPREEPGPHPHAIELDAAQRFAIVADLGLDKVYVYRFDRVRGTLAAHRPPALDLAPGAGPRHVAFHPNGRWAYVINELSSTV